MTTHENVSRLARVMLTSSMMVVACGVTEDLGSRHDAGTGADADASASDAPSGDASPGDAASGDAIVDVDGGSWSPKMLPGLSLWLDDTVGIVMDPAKPGRVKRWLDQSGKGNNADGEGGDGVTMSPSLDPSAINAKDAVVCDLQTILRIPSNPSLQFGTGDFGIIMVMKLDSLNGGTLSLYHKTAIELRALTTAEVQFQAFSELIAIAKVPTDKFQIFVARGKALELRAGAKQQAGGTSTADLSGDNTPVTLCQGNISTKPAIAEVIVVKGNVSDADLATTTSYLKTKFGL